MKVKQGKYLHRYGTGLIRPTVKSNPSFTLQPTGKLNYRVSVALAQRVRHKIGDTLELRYHFKYVL